MQLVRAREFERLLRDRGISLNLPWLWGLGVLRPATMDVWARTRVPKETFDLSVPGDGHEHFADGRPPRLTLRASRRLVRRLERFEPDAWYHPVQIWSAFNVSRRLTSMNVSPMSVLGDQRRHIELHRLAGDVIRRGLKEWLSEWDLVDCLRLEAFIVSISPLALTRINGRVVANSSTGESLDDYPRWRETHTSSMLLNDHGVSHADIVRWHRALALEASLQDPLRPWFDLTSNISWDKWERISGKPRLAHDFYVMAATLRVYASEFLDLDLPEEDEVMYGPQARHVKETLYGASNVAGAGRDIRRRIARDFGVDAEVRVAWMVEGHTEEGFIDRYGVRDSMYCPAAGISVINLFGDSTLQTPYPPERLEKAGREDQFTHVMVDRSAEAKKTLRAWSSWLDERPPLLTAGWKMSEPDFEGANFSDTELADLVRVLANEQGVPVSISGEEISEERRRGARSTEEAIKTCLKGQAYPFKKDRAWGERLADWASDHPYIDDQSAKGERQVVQVFAHLLRAARSDYKGSIERFMVDPETGEIVQIGPAERIRRAWEKSKIEAEQHRASRHVS